jgi:hypothetical protein
MLDRNFRKRQKQERHSAKGAIPFENQLQKFWNSEEQRQNTNHHVAGSLV